jgi:hypothetical protein
MADAVRVSGIGELQAGLREIMAQLQDLKVVQEIAADAANLAASFAPRRTGRLRASIKGSKSKNRAQVRAGGARVPYVAPINYGWPKRNIAPALFMQKADNVMKPKLPGILDAAITRLIEQGRLS